MTIPGQRFSPWFTAPVGTILEMRMSDPASVVRGIRSAIGDEAYMLVLDGDPHVPVGSLISVDLGNNVATDVSEQYKVRATNQRPLTSVQPQTGIAYTVRTEQGAVKALQAPLNHTDRKVWIGIEGEHTGKEIICHGLENGEFPDVLVRIKR